MDNIEEERASDRSPDALSADERGEGGLSGINGGGGTKSTGKCAWSATVRVIREYTFSVGNSTK